MDLNREEYFRNVIEHARDLILVVAEDGEVLYCSPSSDSLLGVDAQRVEGRKAAGFVHREDVERVADMLAVVFERNDADHSVLHRLRHADGRWRDFESTGRAFISESGESRAVIHCRDVTARERTEAQLRQAQKMEAVGQLTGGIAHDFNNLLTVIVGNLQLLEERMLPDDAAQQVATALRAALRSAELTRGLLAFSRRQVLDPVVVNLNALIRGVQPLLQRTLHKPVSVEFRCADGLWPTRVDPAQLESAILNLVINSRDAMSNDGRLNIETFNMTQIADAPGFHRDLVPGDYVVLCVTDDGRGMSDDVLAQAFEPFFSSKPVGQGSGLGLSMVYGFVKQSGGQIRLRSTVGKGTSATIYLPRHKEPRNAADETQAVAPTRIGSETLLVVDDDPDVLGTVSELLTSLGYKVVQASNGMEALRVLARDNVDLLLSDVVMPQMSGTVLARRVAQMYPQLPILLTSGYADVFVSEQDAPESFELMQKPYSKARLANRIRTILNVEEHYA